MHKSNILGYVTYFPTVYVHFTYPTLFKWILTTAGILTYIHTNPTLLNGSVFWVFRDIKFIILLSFAYCMFLCMHIYVCVCDRGYVYASSGECLSIYWQMLNVSLRLRGHPPPSTLNICTLPSLTLHLGPKSGHVSHIHCYSSMLTRTFTTATGIMPLEKRRHSSCGLRQPYIVLQTNAYLNRS